MFELYTFGTGLLCVSLLYLVALGFYRLYLDPLVKFPGPKLAALTLWYECYYDVIKRGKYTFEIEKMHEAYGPIVRISPYELHINDPDYYDDLYVGGSARKTIKYAWVTRMFGISSSMFATVPHDLHRIRRGAIAPFFSKQAVQKLELEVEFVIEKLISRFHALQGSDTSVNLIDAFSALTGDVISQYTFAQPYGLMDSPDFAPWWHKAWMDVAENGHRMKHFAWLEPTLRRMPLWIARILNSQTAALIELQDSLKEQVIQVKTELQAGRKNTGQRTIFHEVLTNDNIRPEEKGTEHLKEEAQLVVAAGTITTAHVLSTASFYLIESPEKLEKLQQELGTATGTDGQRPSWQQLEQLPYLTAVINEGLRVASGIMHRLQRISPDEAIQFNEWTIPPMTPVGMSAKLIHDNPKIFPNPRSFSPERWLQPSAYRLDKYLVPFSRGSRACLGLNLAYCELYLTLAAVFAPGRFRLELFDTDISDVETPHDFVAPCYRDESKGIRVRVK